MKKILYLVTQSELGGAQRYVFDLAGAMRQGNEVTVAFGEQGGKGELAKLLDIAGIKHITIPNLKRDISIIDDLLAVRQTKKIIDDIKPDIVHLNSTKISVIGSLAARISKTKPRVVYTAHGWVFNEPMGAARRRLYVWLEKKTARLKDHIICINQLDHQIAQLTLHVPANKLSIVYHGLPSDNYEYLDRAAARDKIFANVTDTPKLANAGALIGIIANFYPTKDLPTFIKAVHYLMVDYNLPATAVIIGDGLLRGELEELIARLEPNNEKDKRIILAGRIPNADRLLKAFDYYVCSSVKEGFPYTLLEVMMAGVPVISTRVGGIPDLITDNQNGILVDPGDSRTIAKKLAMLIKDRPFTEQMAKRAQDDIEHIYTFDKMVDGTKRAYGI